MRSLRILLSILLLGLCGVVVASADASDVQNLQISWLNGEHTDLDSELAPIKRGPLLLDISSPSHLLTIHSNQLKLRPVAGEKPGTLDVEMEVDFEGTGDLVITLHTDAGKGTTFEDQVVAPRQTVRVAGRAHFQSSPNGYVVTVIDAPGVVELQMESRLADQIVGACTSLAAFLGFDCDGLDESLSVATVPMPSSGTRYFVDAERFTDAERKVLDSMLKGSDSSSAAPTKEEATRISMSLKDADLTEVLRSFAKIGGFNLVLDPSVEGKVTVELKDVAWDEALEQILKINGLAMEVSGESTTIGPR